MRARSSSPRGAPARTSRTAAPGSRGGSPGGRACSTTPTLRCPLRPSHQLGKGTWAPQPPDRSRPPGLPTSPKDNKNDVSFCIGRGRQTTCTFNIATTNKEEKIWVRILLYDRESINCGIESRRKSISFNIAGLLAHKRPSPKFRYSTIEISDRNSTFRSDFR